MYRITCSRVSVSPYAQAFAQPHCNSKTSRRQGTHARRAARTYHGSKVLQKKPVLLQRVRAAVFQLRLQPAFVHIEAHPAQTSLYSAEVDRWRKATDSVVPAVVGT